MLFDERPKMKREELFDREKELNELLSNLHRPLILLTGVRRIGKTSLLLVALNESKIPYILIDARKLKENYGFKDLYYLLSTSLSSSLDRLGEVLKKIKGVNILGMSVELSWKGRNYISLADLFDHLNEKRVIIAIDEAQRLRGPLSKEIRDAIAHAYDYDRNLTFILTGSEIGLLYDFLGIEDQTSPLYGRYYYELNLNRFSRSESEGFLEKGFEEYNVKVEKNIIDDIVNFLDGIPGWLTLAGNYLVSGKSLEDVKKISIEIALNEIFNLLESKRKVSEIVSRRYRYVLKCISEGKNTWSKLFECVSEKEGTAISSNTLSNVLHQLEGMSIIQNYEFLDPVYKEACKRLL
ncbi:ATP-binding protein [Sulfolobus tengchongensis]|uniref:ATP-binding protein n=1 Tax=Sulfolobus tengchongensis TaxID=207809 RepID=A0AAX4L2M2_9CREN